jgi:hypothetical protein
MGRGPDILDFKNMPDHKWFKESKEGSRAIDITSMSAEIRFSSDATHIALPLKGEKRWTWSGGVLRIQRAGGLWGWENICSFM